MHSNQIISNESLSLDHDCKKILRRNSKQKIIKEVIQKLSNNSNDISSSNEINNSNEINYYYYNKNNNNFHLYKSILIFFGCLKN